LLCPDIFTPLLRWVTYNIFSMSRFGLKDQMSYRYLAQIFMTASLVLAGQMTILDCGLAGVKIKVRDIISPRLESCQSF